MGWCLLSKLILTGAWCMFSIRVRVRVTWYCFTFLCGSDDLSVFLMMLGRKNLSNCPWFVNEVPTRVCRSSSEICWDRRRYRDTHPQVDRLLSSTTIHPTHLVYSRPLLAMHLFTFILSLSQAWSSSEFALFPPRDTPVSIANLELIFSSLDASNKISSPNNAKTGLSSLHKGVKFPAIQRISSNRCLLSMEGIGSAMLTMTLPAIPQRTQLADTPKDVEFIWKK
jgi:hypothetical protein